MNKLEQLRKMTTIVCDTGEINEITQYRPTDATTNPSLILKAAEMPIYRSLVEEAVQFGKTKSSIREKQLEEALNKVYVNFGKEILTIIPGRVSTEVDARLSFDIEGSIAKAKTLISLYEAAGINRNRVLIKLASTWEGTQAARVLEKQGIHCNMTLLFSLPQAIACAQASATLISPFVGRILDWYKKAEGKASYPPTEDPGVRSVTEIYNYYKKLKIPTVVMGASFRNIEEILELAGCDLLTISPFLLKELETAQGEVPRKLDPQKAQALAISPILLDEKKFRFLLCEDAMATEKLHEGIRNFAKDVSKLEEYLLHML